MNRVLCVVIIVLAVGYGALWLATNHYRDNALTYKAQRDKKPESWNRRMPPLLTCRCASVMLLRSMQNTRGS
ncbi:hypothetical protein CPQ30_14705 [Escherichia coli]|nr:hypothetical protein [Escherichia coli]QUP74343.1 hypothetical protein CPQ30_14705 [Escherichia coli]UXJ42032.1 hypothetical protein N5913_09025 [Escherichia coli]